MEIKSYITALSLFSLIGALISYLIPQGSSKRSFRFISSVVFVYIIISPLINFDMHDLTFDFSSDRNEYNDSFKAKADKSIEITFENALRIKTEEYLKSINVTAESIEFSCMLGDNSIKVKNIRIHARNNITDKNEVINGLKRYLDVDCDIELIV